MYSFKYIYQKARKVENKWTDNTYPNQEIGKSTIESTQRSKKKKVTKIRRETSYKENEKNNKEYSQTKSWLFLFFRLSKQTCGKINEEGKRKTAKQQDTGVKGENSIQTYILNSKYLNIFINVFRNNYSQKLSKLKEVNKLPFWKRVKIPKLTQKTLENLDRPMIVK